MSTHPTIDPVVSPPGILHALPVRRVLAIVVRQAFLYKRTFHRWLDILFWPIMDLVVFGFITLYLRDQPGAISKSAVFFIGGVIFWDILFRAEMGVVGGFLEDVWSRNVLNIFASPIRPIEYIAGSTITGAIRVIIGASFAVGLARLFFQFNVFTLGLALIPLVVALVAMGWAIGIASTAIVLRFGEGAESLAWAFPFLFQPFSAVFYPVSVYPRLMRSFVRAVPASHAFEGMRAVLRGGGFPTRALATAFALDIVYLIAAGAFFSWMLRQVKMRGLLARFGE